MWRRALWVVSLALPACALSHTVDDDAAVPRDAAPVRDAGPRHDAGPPDLGPPDLGTDLGHPDLGPTSGPCTSDVDCVAHPGTVCRIDPYAAAVDLAPVPLVCEPPNSGAARDGERCDDRDGFSCTRGLCAVAGTCVAPCVPGSEDAATQRCGNIWVRTSDDSMQYLSGLTPRVVAPPDVTHAPLPPVDFGAGMADVFVSLPGATNVVVFEPPESTVFATHFETATGLPRVLFDLAGYTTTSPPPPGPLSAAQSVPTIELPNSPTEPRDTGDTYDVTYMQFLGGPVTSFPGMVLERAGAGTGTTLDIDAFYCGASGFSRIPGEPDVVRPLSDAMVQVRRMFATAGITIGELRVHELVGGLRSRWATIDWIDPPTDEIDLHGLFALSAGMPTPSVPWFFIRFATGLLGLAGGIPGPLGMPGTGGSGIIITIDAIGMTPGSLFNVVIEHETGHYLGLFHTSEMDGGCVEPLGDTPECRPIRDADMNGILDATECRGYGSDNVMFWETDTDRTGFSPDQVSVISRALVLH